MPLLINIIANNNGNLFSFYFTYGSYNNISIGVTVQEYLYKTIYLFVTNINTALSTALSSYSGVIYLSI